MMGFRNRPSRRGLLGAAALLPLAGCTRLDALNGLNAMTPGDGRTRQVARDIYFGSDRRQGLDIYAPAAAGAGGAPLPVVVFFYGGGWSSGQRQDYGFVARAIAARGFVVVVPDYRLAPAHAYPDFMEDGAAAVRWVAAHGAEHGADPGRIALMGHSAGAYISVMLALDPRWLGEASPVKAAVGLAGPYDFLPFEPGGMADLAFGHVRAPAETQPISYVGPGKPPVLLMQGDRDDTVGVHNAVNLDAALTRAGSPSTLRLYQGLGHIGILLAVSKPFRGKAPVLAEASAFLHRVLGEKA
jgi:acetyl esterase/lipase